MADPRETQPAPFGPFHRLESKTQTAADATEQQLSGELWGRVPSTGGWPQVKAYRGGLPDRARGIEFYTDIAPMAPGRWYAGRARGVGMMFELKVGLRKYDALS